MTTSDDALIDSGRLRERAPHSGSLAAYIRIGWLNRHLIWQLVQRDFLARYRGSLFGIAWSFVTPILLLLIYSFVFGVVFKARWGAQGQDDVGFVATFYTGMVVHSIFADALNRAPSLIVGNPSFVKRIVFPLEILPIVLVTAALITGAIGIVILLAFNMASHQTFALTALFLPIVLAPYLLMILAIVLFVSAVGVYFRDLGQFIGLVVTATLFMTPIFYPISAVPASFRPVMYLNPLTFIVEQARAVILYGHLPNWSGLALYAVSAVAALSLALLWFQKTRKGFADVL